MIWIQHFPDRLEKYRWQAGNKQSLKTMIMKKITFITAITFCWNACLFAQERINLNRIGLYTMNIGEIEAIVISDGHLCVNPVQAEFAQHIDSSEVARTLQKHFAPGHTPGIP